ncbi:kinase-like protein [Penicillium paradoxum]|uniref:kinase-like protein n=1 Tax=Penicillium paradoxum TaxID=176176 RepID=UPI002546E2D1|nr:kinase-like protein [Penicillium paradoxum]KAJ5774923.1 kinase-like protein [Penicillium paradoxum]
MRFVFKRSDVPVPEVLSADFREAESERDSAEPLESDSQPPKGMFGMTVISAIPLEQQWDILDSETKKPHARIDEQYLHCAGTRYKDKLPDRLPHSERSVFTHADIASRNVMVDMEDNIAGILGWESAGWYSEYWEYAQIMKPAFWGDWSVWMEDTAVQRWGFKKFKAARKVLF